MSNEIVSIKEVYERLVQIETKFSIRSDLKDKEDVKTTDKFITIAIWIILLILFNIILNGQIIYLILKYIP